MGRTMKYRTVARNMLMAALFTSLVGWTCQKALEEKPRSLLTDKVFYTTASDAILAVNAAYDHMGGGTSSADFGGVYFNSFWVIQAVTSDNGQAGNQDANTIQLSEFRHDPNNAHVEDVWEDTYKTINVANIALANIPSIAMDDGLKSRLLGEVYFIRGLMYFELVRMFGAVPLQLTPTTDLSVLSVERTDAETVYQQIIADLKEAESRLPNQYSGADVGRATTGAASALLAKLFLTRGDWVSARDHAGRVMSLGVYRLLDDYAQVFKISNNNSEEIIFGINYTFNNDAIWETSQFNVRALPLALNRNSNSWEVPTRDVYNDFDALDRRWEVTFATTFTESDGTVLTFDPHVFKYWDQEAEPTASSSGADFYKLRYADVLLMFAEAENEVNGGPSAEAYEALNRVRRRARFDGEEERSVLPDLTGLDQNAFRQAVWKERRREFVWEGQRWFDLVRQGRLKQRVEAAKPSVIVDDQKHILFAIPQRERDLNENLSQNPGY